MEGLVKCSANYVPLSPLSFSERALSQMGLHRGDVMKNPNGFCVHCVKSNHDLDGLKSHNKSKHRKFKVGCSSCGNVFPNVAEHDQHYNEEHSKAERHKLVGRHKLEKKKKKK